MIYTEEDLEQAYAIGYNEAVDDVNEYIDQESMEYSLIAGGKRLRPILVFEAYKLFKDDIEKCYKFAVAMEMVHTFSLIH